MSPPVLSLMPVAWHAATSATITMAIITPMPVRLRVAFTGPSSSSGTCDVGDVHWSGR